LILDPPPWDDFPNDSYIDGYNLIELMYKLKNNRMTPKEAFLNVLKYYQDYTLSPTSKQFIENLLRTSESSKQEKLLGIGTSPRLRRPKSTASAIFSNNSKKTKTKEKREKTTKENNNNQTTDTSINNNKNNEFDNEESKIDEKLEKERKPIPEKSSSSPPCSKSSAVTGGIL